MSQNSLSKDQQKLLKQFKKQVGQPVFVAPTEPKEDDDIDLFAKAMQGVAPIKNDNTVVIDKPKKKKLDAQILAKRIAAEGGAEQQDEVMSDTQAALNPVGSQQALNYRIATLQHRVFEDLKQGKIRWFEAVDLHGCTVEQARAAVLQVIQMAKDENQNVVKIVHGKGPDAILKTYVNGWLRQHRDVLAFVSAPENQGGTGAVLVLIKRTEKNPKYKA
ncbi:Smr/MutS family protein [Acinetobacter sp. HY1485]|uniref:Smr/MutS family protein n=1 Tax=Acinetobacter sp. HY1485 TaxID=2970918 RepID=UPI0022B9B8D3|nr:Smr/MutS family protein [Acinetobacter sp. HY1485]